MVFIFWVVTILIGLSLIAGVITFMEKFHILSFLVWLALCVVMAVFVIILKDGQFILK